MKEGVVSLAAGCAGLAIGFLMVRYASPRRWDSDVAVIIGLSYLVAGILLQAIVVAKSRSERTIAFTSTEVSGPSRLGHRRAIRLAEIDRARSLSGVANARFFGVPLRLYSMDGSWIAIDRRAFHPEDLGRMSDLLGLEYDRGEKAT